MSVDQRGRLTRLAAFGAWSALWAGAGLSAGQGAPSAAETMPAGKETYVHVQLSAIEKVQIGQDRVVRVNGKPFLPIFAWWVYPEQLDELAEIGVNLTLSPQTDPAYARAAMQRGMYVGANPQEDLSGNPAVLLWMQEDEPDVRIPGGPRLSSTKDGVSDKAQEAAKAKPLIDGAMPALKQRLNLSRKCDPSRPVFLNFSYLLMPRFWGSEPLGRELYSAMSRAGDLLSWDIYPIGVFGRPEWIGLVYQGTRRLRSLARDKPVMAFLECTRVHRTPKTRQPTAEEMRNEAWQAITAGATGLGWFTYGCDLADPNVKRKNSFAVSQENRQALRQINAEIQRYLRAAVARELAGGVRLGQDDVPEVAFSLRQDGQRAYFLAVNMRHNRQAISWDGLKTWRHADAETAEQARAKLPAEAWADLAPLEVRILQIEVAGK